MAGHAVFVSYSSEDAVIAEAACDRLEAAGIECWIAPRDAIPSEPYGRQIVDAVANTHVLLLIFSSNSMASQAVLSELELAYKRRKVIVPFRIEAVQPGKDVEFYIQHVHWFDALTPPLESRLDELVDLMRIVLGEAHIEPVVPEPEPQPVSIPMLPEGRAIAWPQILAWYAAAIVIAVVGSYLAYGPLTSDSWHRWALWTQTNVVFLDASRVVIAALLALFCLHSLDVVPSLASKRQSINYLRLEPYERILISAFVVLFVICAYYLLPENFDHVYRQQVASHEVTPGVSDPFSFGQIFGPYFPYSLYVAGLWLGIVAPVLFFMARSLRLDWRAWKALQGTLVIDVPDEKLTRRTITNLVIATQDVFSLLKESAGRYLPIFLAVITMTLVEELTPLKRSVLGPSSDIGKIILWLLWIPTLVILVGLFTILYDGEVKRAKNALSLMIARLQNLPAKTRELQDAAKALRDISDHENSVKALFDVIKTGSVGVYGLVVAVTAITVSVLRFHENWARAFVPQSLIDWLMQATGLSKH